MTMPVFTIKAKDNLALEAICYYAHECRRRGLNDQADEVDKAIAEIQQWRAANPDVCKDPDHIHVPTTAGGQP
jgi:hypothetical protein